MVVRPLLTVVYPLPSRYGNHSAAPAGTPQRLAERVLPWLMAAASDGAFAYDGCKFKAEPAKECTARLVAAQQLKVGLSYTIEASYAGPASGPHGSDHFSTRMLCAQVLSLLPNSGVPPPLTVV